VIFLYRERQGLTMTSQMTSPRPAGAELQTTSRRDGEQPIARRSYRAPALAKGPRLSDVTADNQVSGV
jgi:hypothetical protein